MLCEVFCPASAGAIAGTSPLRFLDDMVNSIPELFGVKLNAAARPGGRAAAATKQKCMNLHRAEPARQEGKLFLSEGTEGNHK